MEAGAGQRLDRGDREEVADRVLRQAVSADLVPVGVKTRARPPRELLEMEMERRPEQALVDRQLPYAADGIGQHFCDVIGPKLDAGVLPPRAHPAQSAVSHSRSKSRSCAVTGSPADASAMPQTIASVARLARTKNQNSLRRKTCS